MKETDWVGFVFGIISMFAGIFLLVPETPEVIEKDIKWHRPKRASSFIEVGINKDNMAKIFISAPAQMFEKKYLISTEAVKYATDTENFQSADNSCTEKTAWMKKDCINYYTEQLIKAEEKLKELTMRGKIFSKADTESIRERIQRWTTSLKDFELKVKKIEDTNLKVAKVEEKGNEYESFVTSDENCKPNLERNVNCKEEYANVTEKENRQVGVSEK